MNDVDSAKALMVLFLNLDYEQRAEFIHEIEILNSRDNFMMTTLEHHFKPIHEVIAQGGEDEDDRYMDIYALGHYDNDQRKVLDVKYDSFADYYIDNDGNDYFDAILLTLCECRAGINAKELIKKKKREALIKEHNKIVKDYDPTEFNFNCSSLFRGLVFDNGEKYKED